ncbi:MAG TPA: 50S ribosomal protein L10 [Dehalococcoidia bacterium]|nr:50S ribosomal protein L10 [Dehalococcoidia bacterium]
MPTAKKVQQVEELRDLVSRATIAISTDYRGLTVSQLQALRRRLRDAGVEIHVVKNTLAHRAATEAGREGLSQIIEGPTALAIGFDDVVAPAKALTEFVRQSRLTVPIRGAYTDGQVLSSADVADLASAPPREELLARIAGGLQSPLVNLMALLSATVRELAGLIDARAGQLEGSEG